MLHRTFILRNDNMTEAVCSFLRANSPALAQAGTPLNVTVTQKGSKRTTDQNARLHALLQDIAAAAWVNGRQYDMETWKEFCRQKFIGTEEIELPDGRRIERGISTTTLDVAAFSAFMDQITAYAQDHLAVEFPS